MNRSIRALLAGSCLAAGLSFNARAAGTIAFSRDIQPILSDNCYHCHGPDKNTREAKLRLDVREEAVGKGAIKPGSPEESELIKRIFTDDTDDLMPPPESHKTLTSQQKELLRSWIAQGAEYETHWSYIPPIKAPVPDGKNGIDHLVQERLKALGLEPSLEANPRTLARRLYFDLAGLPPRPAEVNAFERDHSEGAWDRLVEKLLDSPYYGERMAIPWLDVVRFADTIGYHSDNPRNIWPYRDYVIRAFNENMPFDQFTREQLAGDLLPGSTQEQKVASAFNRLLLSTEEGGAQPKDYEARMLTDRVRAVGSVWLGQTIGCAQCHDHKFDPITSKDFYAMGAFFADIKEPIIGRREDGMLVPTPEQSAELARLDADLKQVESEFEADHPEFADAFADWREARAGALVRSRLWTRLEAQHVESAGGAALERQQDRSILAKGEKPDKDTYTLRFANVPSGALGLRLEALPHDSLPSKGPGRAGNGNFVVTEVVASLRKPDGSREGIRFAEAHASIEQTFAAEKNPQGRWSAYDAIDGDVKDEKFGWAILPETGRPQYLALTFASPLELKPEEVLVVEIQQKNGGGSHTLGHFALSFASDPSALGAPGSTLPPEIEAVFATEPGQRDDTQKEKLYGYFKKTAKEFEPLRTRIAAAQKARNDFVGSIPRCIVSVSMEEPRTVRILPRGNFLIETGEIVQPALPGYLVKEQSDPDRKLTRLDLANWLVDRENPLTARVVMNRLWKQFFGTGLSKVLDDLGAQGEPPPNQALLDWLACEFMDSGWDMKHMVRLIVTSDTYKQSSVMSKSLRQRDPDNRELAAQSRWRLDAELVRDNALAISGLLVMKVGGPSVKPYQPDGYWENLNFPVRSYDASSGTAQYRRGLYTWWQRSFLHPSMLAFDAPSREECAAERNRSNIPQQALVLLNDPTYVEASRAFATRILTEAGRECADRIEWAWEQALARPPREEEVQTIQALVEKHLAEYKADPEAARALLGVGQNPAPENFEAAELAAWTNAARVILNLHETITRS